MNIYTKNKCCIIFWNAWNIFYWIYGWHLDSAFIFHAGFGSFRIIKLIRVVKIMSLISIHQCIIAAEFDSTISIWVTAETKEDRIIIIPTIFIVITTPITLGNRSCSTRSQSRACWALSWRSWRPPWILWTTTAPWSSSRS